MKVNFSHVHPHRVIESMKKAEGRWGKGPGETMGSTGVGQVRLGVSFLDILLENLRETLSATRD